MIEGEHEYEEGDVFYDVEAAADAAADEVLEEDHMLRLLGISTADAYDEYGDPVALDPDEEES